MGKQVFTAKDRRQMHSLGITEAQVLEQLHLLIQPPPPIRLVRPCTLGDGLQKISPEAQESLILLQEKAARAGRVQKFVPASGVASRMFQTLFAYYHQGPGEGEEAAPAELDGDADIFRECSLFLENLRQFAFYQELQAILAEDGHDLEDLVAQGRGRKVLPYFLTAPGLHYGCLPQGPAT